MRRLLIAAAVSGVGLTVASCDPYYYGGAPGPYPDPQAGYPAQPYAPPGGGVSFLGCPVPGVEPNCLSVRSVDGQMFDITQAQARPDPRSPFAVEVSGRVAQGMAGYCQQGAILQDVQVRQTNLRCEQGVVQGYAPPYPPRY